MRIAILLLLLSAGIASARAVLLFQDDFSDTAYSEAHWSYLDASPDWDGAVTITTPNTLIIDNTDPFVYAATYTFSQDYALASDGTATLSSHLSNSSSTDYLTYYFSFDYATDTVTLERDENGTVTTLLTETGDNVAQSGLATMAFTYTPTDGARLMQVSFAGTSYSFDDIKPAILPDGLTFGMGGSNVTFDNVTLEAVPEPSAVALLGLAALAYLSRRRYL